MTQKNFENLQQIIIDFFKDVDDKILSDFVDVFNYRIKATYTETNDLLNKFLDENSIRESFINVLIDSKNSSNILQELTNICDDKTTQFFRRASTSDNEIIEHISTALFNVITQRFRKNKFETKKSNQATISENNKNFNFIKNELLDVYNRLNENEHYLYGKDEDEKLIKKVETMKYE